MPERRPSPRPRRTSPARSAVGPTGAEIEDGRGTAGASGDALGRGSWPARLAALYASHSPGLLLAATIAVAAQFLSEHHGAPAILFALLIGMAFNSMAEGSRCKPGIIFGSGFLLRLGVALLGLRISMGDLLTLGPASIVSVAALLAATIGVGLLGAKLMRQPAQLGLLTGGAVAICGASAALAIAAVMPAGRRYEKEVLLTVAAVTTLSTAAMVLYPIILQHLGLSDVAIGFMLGATIHDVAQVVGAGYSVSETAGETATLVKLLRVSCLPLVLLAVLLATGRTKGAATFRVPWFLVTFGLLAALNSAGLVPGVLAERLSHLSRWLLIAAIAALGVRTSVGAIRSVSGAQITLVLVETATLFAMALVVVWLVGVGA